MLTIDSAEKRIPIKPWYEDSCKALVVEEKELFSSNSEREPKQGDKVVYTSGSFDLFHAGHVDFLRMCKQHGKSNKNFKLLTAIIHRYVPSASNVI